MLEQIKEYITANSTLVLVAIAALVAMIAFVVYRRINSGKLGMGSGSGGSIGGMGNVMPVPTPSHDLEGMDSVSTVCDLGSGVCHPQNLSQEQEQQVMMQQQMMMQQMQAQQQQQQQQPEQPAQST